MELAQDVQQDTITNSSDLYQQYVKNLQTLINLEQEKERNTNQMEFLTDAMATQIVLMPNNDELLRNMYTPQIDAYVATINDIVRHCNLLCGEQYSSKRILFENKIMYFFHTPHVKLF